MTVLLYICLFHSFEAKDNILSKDLARPSIVNLDSINPLSLSGRVTMSPPLKLRAHVEVSRRGDGLDRISSLPDELRVHILSSLPTRCAVRTSILSTRWRYLFTLTNCLSFDDAPFSDGEQCIKYFKGRRKRRELTAPRNGRFEKFVYKVLELHKVSPIEKFSLVCKGIYHQSDLSAWVGSAVQKGVQDLHYQVVRRNNVPPGGLYMCETLVRLKIIGDRWWVNKIPETFWLPRLKILHLEHCYFNDYDPLEKVLSSCQLLEELALVFCGSNSDRLLISNGLLKALTMVNCSFKAGILEIDAPNLSHVTLSCNSGVNIVPLWKNSRALVKAELTFKYCAEEDYNYSSLEHNRGLIKAAAHRVTELHLLSDSLELLFPIDELEQMPEFHKLSRLELGYCPYYVWKNITSLLDESPKLETVIFERGLHRCYRDQVSVSQLKEALVPFTSNVQVIQVHRFCGSEHSLIFLGHLLRNAGGLKRLILYKCNSVDAEEELEISEALQMLPRASTDCCIELK